MIWNMPVTMSMMPAKPIQPDQALKASCVGICCGGYCSAGEGGNGERLGLGADVSVTNLLLIWGHAGPVGPSVGVANGASVVQRGRVIVDVIGRREPANAVARKGPASRSRSACFTAIFSICVPDRGMTRLWGCKPSPGTSRHPRRG